jgi:transposase InsO family protein
MTDNSFSYVRNQSLRELLARHRIRHLTTEPYRPCTNGKVERFHQTMAREWAHGLSYPLTTTTQPSAATLARPLQHAKAAQLARRPATDQPRSQRLWVGQLGRWQSFRGHRSFSRDSVMKRGGLPGLSDGDFAESLEQRDHLGVESGLLFRRRRSARKQ